MARNQVIVSITGNVKGLQSALGQGDSALSKFGKVAGAVSAAAAVAVGAIGVKAVKSASALEQAMGGLGAVFKNNTPQMEEWANKAASSVGLAKSEYASLATVLGAQLKNMGVSTEQLGAQTNDLVGLGADLAAQFGGSTSDAVSALSSLLRGERDPIERYGVSMNEAAVKAKMAEMGLSGLTGESEKNAKLQATLALLYEQTADAQGAFARESTTLAGAQQRLSAGTENLYATLGTSLLPAVTAVTAALGALVARVQESAAFQAFTGWLTEASNAFADFVFGILNGTATLDFSSIFSGLLDSAVAGITNAAAWLSSGGAAAIVQGIVSGREAVFGAALQVFPAILDALIVAIPAIVTGLVAMVMQLSMMLVEQAPVILTGAVTLFTTLLTALVTILPSLIQALVALLPVIVTTLLSLLPMLLEAAVQVFMALVQALPIILPMLITAIVELLPSLITTILGLIPMILQAAVELFTALVESLPIILPMLLQAILNLLPSLISTVISMIPALLNGAVQLFTGIVKAIPKVIPQLIQALIALAPQMVSTLIGLVPQLLQAGIDLVGGLVSGLWEAAGSVGQALLDIAGSAIDGFLSFLGIHSPSRLFMGFGDNLGQGLAIGITKSGKTVSKALDGMSSLVAEGFDARLSGPELAMAVTPSYAGMGSAHAGGDTYNITVHALNPTAETGRIIVQSVEDYKRNGGRL
jgi:hypothetical protein